MAANSFFNHLQDLDFTNEEQDVVFTPSIQWGSLNEDSDLLVIAKIISSKPIDDNTVVRAFQGIILDVSKPVRRCVAIGGTTPSPKLCPLQYERLPTICYGCGHIGHIVESCPTFKQMPTSKLQYGDWIRYIPPQRQELNTHSKGSIRYLDGNRKQISNGKQLNAVQRVDDGKPPNKVDPTPTRASMQDAVSSPHPPIMVSIMNDATYTHPPSIAPKLAAATSHHPPSIATKLADPTSKLPPTAVPKTAAANLSHPSNVAIVGQDTKDAISSDPMTLAFKSQSIGLNGPTLTPATGPFEESNEFMDFLAIQTEAK
ncbi:hypothetical protein V6N11_064799 [Hibiscus sabdariffa]|uniref:CCHC-type domain-containing protein n=1 Tax=Hibiscus sabdariffa TaxID=183260 RepID=A0ABR2SIV4_9ROSI